MLQQRSFPTVSLNGIKHLLPEAACLDLLSGQAIFDCLCACMGMPTVLLRRYIWHKHPNQMWIQMNDSLISLPAWQSLANSGAISNTSISSLAWGFKSWFHQGGQKAIAMQETAIYFSHYYIDTNFRGIRGSNRASINFYCLWVSGLVYYFSWGVIGGGGLLITYYHLILMALYPFHCYDCNLLK